MSFISDIFSGGAEGVFKGVSSIIGTLKADPTEVAKLQAELTKAQLSLEAQLAQADAQALQAVNATMQAESKSDHWAQWAWRPTVGFTFAAMVLNNYVLLAYLSPYGIKPLDIPGEVWNTLLVVLGVAAGGRSLVQWKHGISPKQ